MTIQIVFQKCSERIAVRIIRENILFIDLQTNMMSPIEGLNFTKKGVETEYPDLIGDKEWKQKAIQRFVDKIKKFESERERARWIIEEMKSMNYKPLYEQVNGFRPKKIE